MKWFGGDGWLHGDGVQFDPGPPEKTFGVPNSGEFMFMHSMEAYVLAYLAVHDRVNRPNTSWTGSVLVSGKVLVHYPLKASVFATGNRNANTRGSAWEFEGKKGHPLTPEQVAAGVEIIEAAGRYEGRDYVRMAELPLLLAPPPLWSPGGGVVEHNEACLWGMPNVGWTECPAGRMGPLYAALEGATLRRSLTYRVRVQEVSRE